VRGHGGRYPLLTDEDLISLVGAGDGLAFTVLDDCHSRATYSLARRLTGARFVIHRSAWKVNSRKLL
jgi:hypothetical protein